tara:strand:+ start:597 stop:785 length:189 start_codon:yes stop_codon:yes gene_type:complete
MENDVKSALENYHINEDLYGLSIEELNVRIKLFKNEILRFEKELVKKNSELLAADQLFSSKK